MHIADCKIRLGGDALNIVPKVNVTIAEIALLRAIHGDDAVVDIAPKSNDRRSHRDELNRLRQAYGWVPDNMQRLQEIWSEFGASFPKDWSDLGLQEAFFKADGIIMPEPTEEQLDRAAGKDLGDPLKGPVTED